MKDALIICGIALVVFVVVLVVGFRRIMAQRERAWREMIRRRVQDMEREATFKADAEAWKRGEPPIRIDTPIEVDWDHRRKAKAKEIDWERRYGELVETVAQRTDQAKGAK